MLTRQTLRQTAASRGCWTLTGYGRIVKNLLQARPFCASSQKLRAAAPTVMARDIVEALQPQPLWNLFRQLSEIPRPSKHEEKYARWPQTGFRKAAVLSCGRTRNDVSCRVLNFLKAFAKEHQLSSRQDDTGNFVILRPGSGGGEDAPTIVIQVCNPYIVISKYQACSF